MNKRMNKTHNEEVLTPLVKKFEKLSQQPFSKTREHHIDDLFAELFRANLMPGIKKFDDSTHKDVRVRSFTYQSDDGQCHIVVRVKMYLGQVNQTKFTLKHIFHKM